MDGINNGRDTSGMKVGDQPLLRVVDLVSQLCAQHIDDLDVDEQKQYQRGEYGEQAIVEREAECHGIPVAACPRYIAARGLAMPILAAHNGAAHPRGSRSESVYPEPRTVCISCCAWPSSILRRKRLICTSITLDCGSNR